MKMPLAHASHQNERIPEDMKIRQSPSPSLLRPKVEKIPNAYILFGVLILAVYFVPSESYPYLVPKDPGVFVRPSHKYGRSIPSNSNSNTEGKENRRTIPPPPNSTIGSTQIKSGTALIFPLGTYVLIPMKV